jgi:FtsP/CotA-like multicopper oxidase with cupredoxin domain
MVSSRRNLSKPSLILSTVTVILIHNRWMDGVPGVSQCPIPPEGTFTYSFIADLYGTTWYHSHYSAQYASGLIGPLVVHGPDTVKYDIGMYPTLFLHH